MIIDAFLFFNEINMLKTRLEYYGEHVDKFIVIESTVDFSGKKRTIQLSNSVINSLPNHEKIEVHVWQPNCLYRNLIFPLARTLNWRKMIWKIQHQQRNAILNASKTLSDDDIFIFGDIDEFISRDYLNKISFISESNQIYGVEQEMYYYNLATKHKEIWMGTALCSLKTLRKHSPRWVRHKRLDHTPLFKGWHFSYFNDAEHIKNKIQTISTAENLVKYNSLTIDEIKSKIESGLDLFGRSNIDLIRLNSPDIPDDLLTLINRNFKT